MAKAPSSISEKMGDRVSATTHHDRRQRSLKADQACRLVRSQVVESHPIATLPGQGPVIGADGVDLLDRAELGRTTLGIDPPQLEALAFAQCGDGEPPLGIVLDALDPAELELQLFKAGTLVAGMGALFLERSQPQARPRLQGLDRGQTLTARIQAQGDRCAIESIDPQRATTRGPKELGAAALGDRAGSRGHESAIIGPTNRASRLPIDAEALGLRLGVSPHPNAWLAPHARDLRAVGRREDHAQLAWVLSQKLGRHAHRAQGNPPDRAVPGARDEHVAARADVESDDPTRTVQRDPRRRGTRPPHAGVSGGVYAEDARLHLRGTQETNRRLVSSQVQATRRRAHADAAFVGRHHPRRAAIVQ